jgi:hypothetical protein
MAEQSLGWATTGTGDGVSGGYNESRMTSMQTNTFGAGVMFTGNRFQRTWTTTSVTVNTGACMVNGYFYENTASETINLTSGTAGTYYLVVYLNTNAISTACVANVTANNPSGITIGAKTCRIAIVTAAAYASPPSGTVFIPLHSIAWSGTAITAVTDIRQFVSPVTPNLSTIRMLKTAAQIITSGTGGADVITYASKWQATDGLMTADVSTGVVTLNTAGIYLVDFSVLWQANIDATPGNRYLRLCSASEQSVEVCAVNLSPGAINDGGGTTSYRNFGGTLVPGTPDFGLVQRATATIIRDQANTTSTPTYETLFLRVAQDSGANINLTRAQITVTRLSDVPPIS